MYEEKNPLLPQYIVSLHGPNGWTLRQIAAAIGLSPEWVRQLELQGMREIARRGPERPVLPPPRQQQAEAHRHQCRRVPATGNGGDAQDDERGCCCLPRQGSNKAQVESFNKMIQLLLDAGVPIRAIATALDEDYLTFYRRMRRWGVRSPAFEKQGEVVKPAPKVKVDYCTDPSCPIEGQHVHG